MLLLPKFAVSSYIAQLGIAANQLTVRIHTGLIAKYQRWTKLWYFLRGLDRSSSGFGRILLTDICYWLGAAPSTVRQWFREGKAAGAFRFWAERRGIITIAIGSPTAVCIGLKLWQRRKTGESIRRAWGTVSEISIFELDRLRQHATAVTVQHLQSQSHFAAKLAIPEDFSEEDRQKLEPPKPLEFFARQGRASQNPSECALLPFCLRITNRRIWTSKSFQAFGCRQSSVAQVRGFTDRTIRNHLSTLNVERKQIVQAKGAYRQVVKAIDQEAEYGSWGEGTDEVTLLGNITGWDKQKDKPILVHKLCEGLAGEFPQGGIDAPRERFFSSWGKWWIHRCCLYNLDYPLHSMEYARDRWWDIYVFEILARTTTVNKSSKNAPPPKSSGGWRCGEMQFNDFSREFNTTSATPAHTRKNQRPAKRTPKRG